MIQGVNPTIRPSVTPTNHEAGRDEQPVQPGADGAVDSLEISEATREKLDNSRDAQVRSELVHRVRAEIAQGNYLTDDKLDGTVDRLVDELFGGF